MFCLSWKRLILSKSKPSWHWKDYNDRGLLRVRKSVVLNILKIYSFKTDTIISLTICILESIIKNKKIKLEIEQPAYEM